MISKPSSAEREGSHIRLSEFFHMGLFYQQLQRQWPAGLMYFIILLFAFPVAAMLLMKEPEPLYSYFSSNIFALIYALFAGILSGITVIRFLYQKDSTNFYHCLPVKRTCWLLTNTVSSLCMQILAWLGVLAALSLVLLMSGASLPEGGAPVWEGFFAQSGQMLVYYLFFFGVSLFAGMLCGSGPMHLFMTLFMMGIVPVLYLAITGMLLTFSGTLNADYYLSLNIFRSLSTFVTLCSDVGTVPPVSSYLRAAFTGILLITASFFCYRIRRSERSGQPVVFDFVRRTLKYLIMIPAALGIGIFFYALGSEAWIDNSLSAYLWFLFGILCGVFLSFMLLNTILNRNAKMMFSGMRSCAVFTAAVLLFANLTYFDVLGLRTYVPKASAVEAVELRLGRSYASGIMIDDDEAAALICERLRTFEKSRAGRNNDAYHYYPTDSIIYHTHLGIPVAKLYDMEQIPEEWYREIVQAVVSLDDFAERYLAPFYDDLLTMPDTGRYVSINWGWSESNSCRLSKEDFVEILDACRADFREKGSQAMQGTLIGTLESDGNIIPIFLDSSNLLEVLSKHISGGYMGGWSWISRMNSMFDAIYQITVYDTTTETKWVVKEDEEIRELLPHLSGLSAVTYYDESNKTPYTLRDSRYQVEISWGTFDWLYSEKHDYPAADVEAGVTVTYTNFLFNSVPEWIGNG